MRNGDRQELMSTAIRKYSLTINRHRTSISLEKIFYEALGEVAEEQGKTLPELIGEIDARPRDGGLSSALRVYLLEHFRRKAGCM